MEEAPNKRREKFASLQKEFEEADAAIITLHGQARALILELEDYKRNLNRIKSTEEQKFIDMCEQNILSAHILIGEKESERQEAQKAIRAIGGEIAG